MQQDWREFSGFGELLCLVLAWTVGIAALWSDYSGKANPTAASRIASGPTTGSGGNLD